MASNSWIISQSELDATRKSSPIAALPGNCGTLKRQPEGDLQLDILPDILEPGLKVLFCGVAASPSSARQRAYYAGPGNKFWRILFETGLTPVQMKPSQFRDVARYGIGLTDIVKSEFGRDREISDSSYDAGRLRRTVDRVRPRALAFTGKQSASKFFLVDTKAIDYGRQPRDLGHTSVFVLPSTSGAASGFWDPDHWHELAAFLRNRPDRTRTMGEGDAKPN